MAERVEAIDISAAPELAQLAEEVQGPEEAVIEAAGSLPESLLLDDTEVPVRHIGQWSMVWYRFTRNRMAVIGAWVLLAMILLAVFGPLFSPGFVPIDPITHNLPLWAMQRANHPLQLSWPFIMGTDGSGNVVITYVLSGGRPLLAIGILGALLASLLGMVIGGLAGYLGGMVDGLHMRLVDALLGSLVFMWEADGK